MIKHVVLFKPKTIVTEAQASAAGAAFRNLVGVVPGLLDCAWGANISPEGRSKGFTHGFVMTFADVASRDGYLPHPGHKEAGSTLREWIDDVFVFDFEY